MHTLKAGLRHKIYFFDVIGVLRKMTWATLFQIALELRRTVNSPGPTWTDPVNQNLKDHGQEVALLFLGSFCELEL